MPYRSISKSTTPTETAKSVSPQNMSMRPNEKRRRRAMLREGVIMRATPVRQTAIGKNCHHSTFGAIIVRKNAVITASAAVPIHMPARDQP